jgi:hypothetical protein
MTRSYADNILKIYKYVISAISDVFFLLFLLWQVLGTGDRKRYERPAFSTQKVRKGYATK